MTTAYTVTIQSDGATFQLDAASANVAANWLAEALIRENVRGPLSSTVTVTTWERD